MKNILKSIAGFFAGIYQAVVKGGDPTIVKLPDSMAITPELIDHCINTVNIIKRIVNNPVAILITDLTPIQLDNNIRLKIAEALPAILAGLTFEKDALTNASDNNVLVNDLLSKVRLADDADKDALYHALTARLIMIVSDGTVTWSETVGMLEIYFKQLFGKAI